MPGFASDVWGLGTSLFYAAAGFRPFPHEDGASDADDCDARWPQRSLPPAPLPDRVDPGLRKAIEACLTVDPAGRPTPADVAGMLEPMLSALPRPRLAGFKVSMR